MPPRRLDSNREFVKVVWDFLWFLPSAIAVGAGLGYLLDRWLGTSPWGISAGGAFGVVTGLWSLVQRARAFGDEGKDQDR